jgi:hypothetical protein
MRLANQALQQIYGKAIPGAAFPLFAGSKMTHSGTSVTVTVSITEGGKPDGKPVALTTTAPAAATQTTTLGKGPDVPRNMCITAGFANTFPQDCGYPGILGKFANGTAIELNATATIGTDGSSIVLTATSPTGFTPFASSYGRASWARTVFFSKEGGLPVIPWFANFSVTNPWTPPPGEVRADQVLPTAPRYEGL